MGLGIELTDRDEPELKGVLDPGGSLPSPAEQPGSAPGCIQVDRAVCAVLRYVARRCPQAVMLGGRITRSPWPPEALSRPWSGRPPPGRAVVQPLLPPVEASIPGASKKDPLSVKEGAS